MARCVPFLGLLGLLALLASAACQVRGDSSEGPFLCTDSCPGDLKCLGGRCVADFDSGAAIDGALDANQCVCTSEIAADDCGGGAVDIGNGERACASTELNTNALLGCPANPMPGLDAAYRVAVTAGQTLTAVVRPTGFDASIYLTLDCSGSCIEIANAVGLGGTETVSAQIATTGDVFIVVDSPSGNGCYELSVSVE